MSDKIKSSLYFASVFSLNAFFSLLLCSRQICLDQLFFLTLNRLYDVLVEQ